MIEAKSLMYENYVYCHGEIRQVIAIRKFEVELDDVEGNISVTDLDGIELIPELLEKCGFKLDGFKQYNIELPKTLSTGERKLYFSGDYLYLEETEKDAPRPFRDTITIWNKDLMKVFYLHSLQTIFYSLTGTELSINL